MPNDDPKRPSFEERMEAFNQAIELLVSMQLDNEKRHAKELDAMRAAAEANRAAAEANRAAAETARAADSAKHSAGIAEIRETLTETANIQRQQAAVSLTHAKALAEHDERMDRIGRHLEVLIGVVDGVIRDSGRRPA